MKIILLPGMDGTGLLFEPLLAFISTPYEIISYSHVEDQSYEAIYTYIRSRIPNEPFYLLAESFSGPIAARLATEDVENLMGVIFVATFLSCPSKTLVRLAQRLPLKALLRLPFATYFISNYLIGKNFLVKLFYDAMASVSAATIKARLASLENLRNNFNGVVSTIPSIYLRAENDLLVSPSHTIEFLNAFPEIHIKQIQGTHFLLQSNPLDCAQHIKKFVKT